MSVQESVFDTLKFFLEKKLSLGVALQNLGPDVQNDSLPINIRGEGAARSCAGR